MRMSPGEIFPAKSSIALRTDHGIGHHVPRMVLRLGDHFGVGVENRAREIIKFIDNRRVRRANDGSAHLAYHSDQAFAHDLESDWIDMPVHEWSRLRCSSPNFPISTAHCCGTTVTLPISSMRAGPAIRAPLASRSRS